MLGHATVGTTVIWDPYWVPLIFGNFQIETAGIEPTPYTLNDKPKSLSSNPLTLHPEPLNPKPS